MASRQDHASVALCEIALSTSGQDISSRYTRPIQHLSGTTLTMLKAEGKFPLTRMVDALPVWMEEGQAAKILLQHSAQRGVIAFVRTPPHTIVLEQALLTPAPSAMSLARMEVPMMTGALQMLKSRGGDVMDHPVAKPQIRLLELEPADLESMKSTGYAKRHWFRSRGISSGSAESQSMVLEPKALRCIRPALTTDGESNQVARRIVSAITFDTDFVYDFTVKDVYVRSADAYALKHIVFRPEDSDPHRMFDSAPAVYQLYSAARKYTGKLEKLPRGRSRIDQERLLELKQEVFEYLERFGEPFVNNIQKEQIFRFIDPKHPWGRGAPRKPFSEAIATIRGFDEKYAYENFVTDGLGLIIYITRWAIAQRFKLQRAGSTRALTAGSVQNQLVKHNFSGSAEIETVASMILWQGKKPKRKTASEKRPEPYQSPKRKQSSPKG